MPINPNTRRGGDILKWEKLSNEEKLKSLRDAIDDLDNEMTMLKEKITNINSNLKRANEWSVNVEKQINHNAKVEDYLRLILLL